MGDREMTLLTSADYSLSYLQSFKYEYVAGSYNLPIPNFNTTPLTKDLILVKCTTDTPNGIATGVGTAVQFVTLDNGEVMSVGSHKIYLGTQLLQLETFTPYYLRVFPLSRLRQLTLTVREYNG